MRRIFAIAVFCIAANAAGTNAVPPPVDPAKVTVPPLVFTPKPRDGGNEWRYHVFQKDGVSFEIALADLRQCTAYTNGLVAQAPIPAFVPFGASGFAVAGPRFANMGLVGNLVIDAFMSGMQSEMESYNLRRCMTYKGYRRYGVTRKLWSELTKGSSEEVTVRMALIASGAKPQAEALEP